MLLMTARANEFDAVSSLFKCVLDENIRTIAIAQAVIEVIDQLPE